MSMKVVTKTQWVGSCMEKNWHIHTYRTEIISFVRVYKETRNKETQTEKFHLWEQRGSLHSKNPKTWYYCTVPVHKLQLLHKRTQVSPISALTCAWGTRPAARASTTASKRRWSDGVSARWWWWRLIHLRLRRQQQVQPAGLPPYEYTVYGTVCERQF